jgi:PAS domain S-box-containing protein
MKQILIVEDERIVAESLAMTLRDLGYGVAGVAASGDGAIELAQEKRPDLILMDVLLHGDMTGIGAAEEIRSQFRIPIIYLTAYADDKTLDQAKVTEPFGYLIKPFEERELHASIEMALYKSEMERSLRESEERYKELAESIGDVFFAMDKDLRYTYWNRISEELFGLPAKDVVGKTFQELFPQLAGTETEELYRKEVLDAAPRTVVDKIDVGGKTVYFEVRIYPSKKGISVFARDVTERKIMEEALRESEERYRSIFESAVHGIFQSTRQGHYLNVNPAYASMLGYGSPQELMDSVQEISAQLFVNPEDRLAFVNSIESRGMLEGFETQICTREGKTIWISTNARAVRNEEGDITHYEGFVANITARKEAEQAVKRSAEQLRTLNARLTEAEQTERRRLSTELHDLVGQNLTALSINLNILKGQLSENIDNTMSVRLDDSLDLVEETVDHIRDVMAELRPPVLDDYGLLAALRWYGNRFAGRTGLQVAIRGEELSPRLPTSVEMVLFKIALEAFTNVAKHSGAARVEVSLEESEGLATLTISDDGVGFDPLSPPRNASKEAWGLKGMKERADSIGGNLTVLSGRQPGTRIVVTTRR